MLGVTAEEHCTSHGNLFVCNIKWPHFPEPKSSTPTYYYVLIGPHSSFSHLIFQLFRNIVGTNMLLTEDERDAYVQGYISILTHKNIVGHRLSYQLLANFMTNPWVDINTCDELLSYFHVDDCHIISTISVREGHPQSRRSSGHTITLLVRINRWNCNFPRLIIGPASLLSAGATILYICNIIKLYPVNLHRPIQTENQK